MATATHYRVSCKRDVNDVPRPGVTRASIPLKDTTCYTTLRRGFDVDLLHGVAYTEAVCMWPHPELGHFVFRMSLPQASNMQRRYPEFGVEGAGLCGQWRLECKGDTLVVDLVRKLELREFWALACKADINPGWLEPCFAPYFGVDFESLATMADTMCDEEATPARA
jgi:hypothetical protein